VRSGIARHDHIGHQEIEFSAYLFEAVARFRRPYLQAAVLQRRGKEPAHRLGIFHQQYAFAAGRRRGCGRRNVWTRRSRHRQYDLEARALAGTASDRDDAAGLFDDPVHRGEAEPGAAARVPVE
jgi:hypothetical protein